MLFAANERSKTVSHRICNCSTVPKYLRLSRGAYKSYHCRFHCANSAHHCLKHRKTATAKQKGKLVCDSVDLGNPVEQLVLLAPFLAHYGNWQVRPSRACCWIVAFCALLAVDERMRIDLRREKVFHPVFDGVQLLKLMILRGLCDYPQLVVIGIRYSDILLKATPESLSVLSSPEAYLPLLLSLGLSPASKRSLRFSAANLSNPNSEDCTLGALKTCLSPVLPCFSPPGRISPPGACFAGIMTSESSMTRFPIVSLP